MSAKQSHTYWSRADAPGRTLLMAALSQLQPGQRLRVADVLPRRGTEQATSEGERAEIPPLLADYTSTAIRASSVDADTRECELSFSSEAPYERWWGVEILGHKSGEVDLGWMASGRAPFLSNHEADEQIGVVTRAWLDNKTSRGRAVVRFGKGDAAEAEMQDAMDGVRVNVSVGYEIRELELIKKDGDTPTYRVTDWLPLECSLVSIPADMTVGLGRSMAAEPTAGQLARTIPQARTEQTMTQVAEKPQAGDEVFKANVAIIQRLAKAFEKNLKASDVADAIAEGADPQKFNELIMARMQSGATDTASLVSLGVTQREAKNFSFMRAIRAQIPQLNEEAGFEREVSRELAKRLGRDAEGIFIPADVMMAGLQGRGAGEKRDFSVGTAGEAGNLVQTTVDASMWTDVLRPFLVMGQLGIITLPGLTSNLAVPRKTVAGTLAMVAEVAAAAETQPTTSLSTLSPKRVSAFVEPSKQAIIQSSLGVEAMLRQDLLDGCAVLLESAGINGSGTAPNPRGIRNVSGIGSVVGGVNGLAFSWAHAVGLETAVANANAGTGSRSGYLSNTKVRGTAKTTQKAANLPFMWDNAGPPLNGYAAAITNNVPSNLTKGTSVSVCSSVVFSADWSMFILGLFGGLDVTVDPYSLATTGQVRITLNQFYDWLCRQPGAFAVMDDALTP